MAGTLGDSDSSAGPAPVAPPDAPLARTGWGAARGALGVGLLAAAAGVSAMLIARLIVGIPTPAELFGDQLTVLIPLDVFSTLLQLFGHSAKSLFYASLVLAQGVSMALLASAYYGARFAWAARVGRRAAAVTSSSAAASQVGAPRVSGLTPWADTAALASLFWIISAGVVAPLIGGGAFGSQLGGGSIGVLAAEAVPALTWAIVFVQLARRNVAAGTDVTSPERRRLLRQAGFGLAVLAGVAVAWRFIAEGASSLGLTGATSGHSSLDLGSVPERIVPPPIPNYGSWTPVTGQSPEVTANADFYYVSKNLVGDPMVDARGWHLAIGGLVERPTSLTYDQLRALPTVERYHTLECISNELGGDLMSNALFTGVRLADLLASAGIQPGASEVIFRAADGYSDSIHLTRALDPRAMLAYHINGRPLPQPHGFPARLLVPGLYGMKNGKWITQLELGAGGYTGYWEERGWTPEAIVKTTARIDTPTEGDLLTPRPLYLAGVAYSADRGIAQVDVSTDGGRTWIPATLKRPLGDLTWVLWEVLWTPTQGTHVVVARAVELDGRVQQPTAAPPLPDGASGYQAITVNVG